MLGGGIVSSNPIFQIEKFSSINDQSTDDVKELRYK